MRMLLDDIKMYRSPDDPPQGGEGDQPGTQPPGGETPPDGGTPQDWDAWLKGQSEEVKARIADHVQGLKNTADARREEREQLREKLRDATAKLEKGSQVRADLEKLAGEVENANRKADFFEQVSGQVSNPRLAWAAVQNDPDRYIDRRGNVLLDKLKADYPELFAKTTPPPGHAGSGTQAPPPGKGADMDAIIRRSAGVSGGG